MINSVWFFMVVIGILVAGFNGRIDSVSTELILAVREAVELALGLIGVMSLWLGLMRIAERSGFIEFLARAVQPFLRLIFPEIPPRHPAMGAVVMALTAGALGLGNASTPLGLKAMKELQALNPHPEIASNAMVTFLAVETSSITILPATVLALRASAGSADPAEIIGPTIIVSLVGTIAGVLAAKILERLPAYRIDPPHRN